MSWDTINYNEVAICACGGGTVIRHMQQRDDDWNRSETSCLAEELNCPICKTKYHIEHHIRHFSCLPWKGDGVSDRVFLVPNGISIPSVKSERHFSFSEIDKEIVANISLSEIKESINDMIENKYTARLKLSSSHSIVGIYQKQYKKKSLNLIVPILKEIVQKYDSYEWTPEKIEEYCKIERKDIEENNRAIEDAIKQSFELDFKRG